MTIEAKEALAEALGKLLVALAGTEKTDLDQATGSVVSAWRRVVVGSPSWRTHSLLNLMAAAERLWSARDMRRLCGLPIDAVAAALVAVETCLENELEVLDREIAAGKAVA